MGRAPGKLEDKHWKALQLLSEGTLSLKEVAEQSGFNYDHLRALINGNSEKSGYVGELFSAEMRKIDAKLAGKIKSLLKQNKVLALNMINDVLCDFKRLKSLGLDEIKVLTSINNSLAKETPNVEIGNLSYNYTKGLTAEELVHEFNRLKAIANGASNRGAVSKAFEGRPGILSVSDDEGSGAEGKSEDPDVSPDAEAGDVS